MNRLSTVITCLAILSGSLLRADEPAKKGQFSFAGKVVVVELVGLTSTDKSRGLEKWHVLHDADLRTVGGRTFLIGIEIKPLGSDPKPVTAIAWDRVETFTVYNDLDALRKNDLRGTFLFLGSSGRENGGKPTPEFEVERLSSEAARLDHLILEKLEFAAQTKASINRLTDEIAKARDTEAKKELEENLKRRKAEVDAIEKQVAKLKAERKPLKQRADELRHQLILEGKVP